MQLLFAPISLVTLSLLVWLEGLRTMGFCGNIGSRKVNVETKCLNADF